MTFELVNYFDVFGNKKDGYEVNDQHIITDNFCINDDSDYKEILENMKQSGYICTSDRRRIGIEPYGSGLEIYEKKTGRPIFGLISKE